MKKVILATVLFTLSGSVLSSSLQDQLAAVAQAEQQGKNEENRQRDALQAKRDQEAQQERQRQANAAAVAKQRAKAAEAERKARQAKLAAEAAQDKARDQSYEDELRRLEIQKQKLALAREEARVKRENEFIDQELKSKLPRQMLFNLMLMQTEIYLKAVAICCKAKVKPVRKRQAAGLTDFANHLCISSDLT